MPQIVHRPTVFDDEERYPFGIVLCKEDPYPKTQGESFDDPEDPVESLFVAGCGFVIGDVSKESPHNLIFSPDWPSNLRFPRRVVGPQIPSHTPFRELALRHQLAVLRRSVKRPKLTSADRLFWTWLCEIWIDWRSALVMVKPETVIAWHRKGFRLFWTWKVRRGRSGRPAVPKDVRDLIRKMSRENPLWGAPRIHGELLKLGINVGETNVGKYSVHGRKPPSQTWRTFLENHLKTMVSVDFFTAPTIRFQVVYLFLVLAHDRRRIVHFNVTAHPTAEWAAHQLREAFPFEQIPRYLLRDRDCIFGAEFGRM